LESWEVEKSESPKDGKMEEASARRTEIANHNPLREIDHWNFN